MPPRKGKAKAKKAETPEPPSIPGAPTYPGKNAEGKGMDAPQWEACRRMLEGVYNTREDDVYIAEIFCQLPDREDYADYYDSIPEPECLDNVATLLSNQAFPTPDKFFAQLLLIFLNAKHYNEEGSQLYEDADGFEQQIWAEWRKHAEQGLWKAQPQLPKTQAKRTVKGKAKAGSADPVTTASRVSATPAPAAGPASSALPTVSELPKLTLIAPTMKTTRSGSGSGPGPASKISPAVPPMPPAAPTPAVEPPTASRKVSGTGTATAQSTTQRSEARPASNPSASVTLGSSAEAGPSRITEPKRELRGDLSGPRQIVNIPALPIASAGQQRPPQPSPIAPPPAPASTNLRPLPQNQPSLPTPPSRSHQVPGNNHAGPAAPAPSVQPYRPPLPPASNKTFGAMYGGQQAMDQVAYKEYLPLDTARLFDRDARQTVLWFSGPPLPSVQESMQPTHSLAYLSYLAKRKRADEGDEADQRRVRS